MGGSCASVCASGSHEDHEYDIHYENMCANIENKLGLGRIEIKDLEEKLEAISYKSSKIEFEDLADIFIKFGIPRNEFLSENSIFIDFYNGLIGTIEEDKGYILCHSE